MNDVIVVAGIERDAVGRARFDHAAHHVERTIAIERRDLDCRPHSRSRQSAARTTPAARSRRRRAADRIRPAESRARRYGRARSVRLRSALHGRKRKKAGVIAKATRDLRLLDGLRRAAGEPRDHHDGAASSSRPRCAWPSRAPAGKARPRGSRTAWCERRPQGRPRRRRDSSVSGRAGGARRTCGMRRAPADAPGSATPRAQRREHLRWPILPVQTHHGLSSNLISRTSRGAD